MREQIINGKFYSTDTAIPLAGFCTSFRRNDPRQYEEILYRKTNGEFFLFGQGGSMSKYANCSGRIRTGDSRITPLSPAEARTWCKNNCAPRAYELIFGVKQE